MGRSQLSEYAPMGAIRLGGILTYMGHIAVGTESANRPVVLVHGWGGSFESTWRSSGFADLLEDSGRTVIGVDLLGHGVAPKPHDPEAYSDLTQRVLGCLPDEPCDLVGFSLGAITLLQLAINHPDRVHSLVLAGIGRNVIERDESGSHDVLVQALEGKEFPDNNLARLFVQYAEQPGNDRVALTAIMKRDRAPYTPEQLARVTCPVLVAIGDQDFAGPGDGLVNLLPNARLVVLKKCDHFATTENFDFFDAALSFLEASPS